MNQNLANSIILPPKNGGLKAWSHSVRKANVGRLYLFCLFSIAECVGENTEVVVLTTNKNLFRNRHANYTTVITLQLWRCVKYVHARYIGKSKTVGEGSECQTTIKLERNSYHEARIA